jgi:hypothetical protein
MRLHWLTSQLSVTVTDYHTLSRTQSLHFTLRTSRRDLTPRIHCFLNTDFFTVTPGTELRAALVELLSKTNFLDAPIPLIKPSIVRASLLPGRGVYVPYRSNSQVTAVLRHRVSRPYLGNERAAVWRHHGCSQETYANGVAWRHRGCAEKTPPPITAAQRVFGRELFSGRLPSNAPLRNPCRATQQLVG